MRNLGQVVSLIKEKWVLVAVFLTIDLTFSSNPVMKRNYKFGE